MNNAIHSRHVSRGPAKRNGKRPGGRWFGWLFEESVLQVLLAGAALTVLVDSVASINNLPIA